MYGQTSWTFNRGKSNITSTFGHIMREGKFTKYLKKGKRWTEKEDGRRERWGKWNERVREGEREEEREVNKEKRKNSEGIWRG